MKQLNDENLDTEKDSVSFRASLGANSGKQKGINGHRSFGMQIGVT